MNGDAVDFTTVDHDACGTCVNGCGKGWNEDLAKLTLGDPSWGSVFSCEGAAVADIVLQRRCNGGGAFLVAFDHGHTHVADQLGCLSEGFPEAGPTGVACHVEDGREIPRNARSCDFHGGVLREFPNQCRVPCCGQSNLLGAEHRAGSVRGAVDGINSIEDRNAGGLFGGRFLDASNQAVPLFGTISVPATVQDAAHLQIHQDLLEFRGVQTVGLLQSIGSAHAHHIQGELCHFSGLVLDGHGPKYTVYKGSAVILVFRSFCGLAARKYAQAKADNS